MPEDQKGKNAFSVFKKEKPNPEKTSIGKGYATYPLKNSRMGQ